MISEFFDEGYLYVESLRKAVDLRDQVLEAVVEAKTVRTMEKVLRKKIRAEVSKQKRGGKVATERVLPELPTSF